MRAPHWWTLRGARFRWGTCANCLAPGYCLCWDCLRAMVAPLILAELIRWAVGR